MSEQLDFFADARGLPAGFRYQPELITSAAEEALVMAIRELPLREFEFHGYTGKRRTISFGWTYDYSREALQRADPMPSFLAELQSKAASFAGRPAEALEQVLITEYGAGAGIGWHRDKSVFGDVIGVSLLSPCQFRLRRRNGAKWERVTIKAEPRSVYLLSGAARTEWEHSIPEVDALRYSVTFRTRRSTNAPSS
jgi:alkylated DNA repair dioxygenase AlkB